MKYIKVLICIMLMLSITVTITNVNAREIEVAFLDDIIKNGTEFFKPTGGSATDEGGIGAAIKKVITENLVPLVETVGNFIFFVVGAFLGLKYIWSGVEGKSTVKQTLPTFFVAATVFYSAALIYEFANTLAEGIFGATTYNAIESGIWGNIVLVVNVLAIAGIVALGLKYMFAAADTRADIKKDMLPVVIGLVLIYSLSNIFTFLANATSQIIP